MVNRPDSSSTRSDKSSSSTRSNKTMNRGTFNKNSFVRSKSGNDYNDKTTTQGKLRNSSSLQSIAKASSRSGGGMRKFKSNGRFVGDVIDFIRVDPYWKITYSQRGLKLCHFKLVPIDPYKKLPLIYYVVAISNFTTQHQSPTSTPS